MLRIKCLLFCCLWLGLFAARAQVVDDTTKVRFTSKDVRYFTEEDLLEGRYDAHPLDTTLTNIHNETRWFHDSAYHQILENWGTAAQPLFWRMPRVLGLRPGKNVFDLYAYRPEGTMYYDAHSPYSYLKYITGYRGTQYLEAAYSRNIRPWWNAGLKYQRLFADRQIASQGQREEAQVQSQAVVVQTSLQSKNGRYWLAGNFTHFNHLVLESGGVKATLNTPEDSLYQYRISASNLTGARNRDLRNNWHLYQQFQLAGESLKLYHVFDRRKQTNRFRDEGITRTDTANYAAIAFYPTTLETASDTVRSKTIYEHLENTLGLRGNRNHIAYSIYAKRRDIRAHGWLPEQLKESQNFIGGDLGTAVFDSLVQVRAEGEKLLSGKDYRARASASFWGFTLAQEQVSLQPSLTEQYYTSDLFTWRNDFRNTLLSLTEAQVKFKLLKTEWKAGLQYLRHKNLVYFDTSARPAQSTSSGNVLIGSLSTLTRFGKFHWYNHVTWSEEQKVELIRMPQFFINNRLYYQGALYKGAVFGQAGIETRYWTGYYADTYMPATQQFYLQNSFRTPFYPMLDLFLNADIKTVNIFLKVAHVNQGWSGPGYSATPFYPYFRRTFVLGVQWRFFD